MSKFKKVFLDEIVENFDSVRIPLSGIERDKIKDKKYPYYGAQGIIDYVDKYLFDGEYILVAEDGNNLKTQTNNVCTYTNGRFWVNNHAHIIKSKNSNNNRYIYYLLNLVDFKKYVTGSAQPKLTQDNLNKIELTIHDVENQDKIANILSSLDSKIELNNKINKELESMAKTLYDYWFVQFDFPDVNEKPYKSSGGKMVYNQELKRESPEGWEVCRLDKIEDNIITGKTPPKVNPEYFDGDIPFITIGDIRGNMHISSTEETLTKLGADYQNTKYVNKGALCVSCIASPGLIGFATKLSQTNQQINSIECKKEENSFYLYFALNDFFNASKAKTGNTFPNMNKGDFADIKLIKPNEQVLLSFSKKIKSSIEQIYINSEQNQELAKLRDWLLPMLMNGQVKVK